MNSTAADNWQRLRDKGLVDGPMRLTLGVAGWIAALFLLGFIATGLAWVIKSELTSFLAGIVMMAGAWLMLSRLAGSEFVVQLALALSLAGQVLFGVGIFGWLGMEQDASAAWLVMTLAQAALAVVMPNATHRLWSAFAATVAFYLLLRSLHLGFACPGILLALAAWAWLHEFSWPRYGPVLRPLAYGLVLALVATDMATGAFQPLTGMGVSLGGPGRGAVWTGQMLLGAVMLSVVWVLLRRREVTIPGRVGNAALAASLILIFASFEAPGITVGVCVILLGHAHGNRSLVGLGVTALLLYLASYYYSLDQTLLVKAQSLAAVGAVLLMLRWLLVRWQRRAELG